MIHPRFNLGIDDQRVLIGALRIVDILIVSGTGLCAYTWRHSASGIPDHYLVAIAIGALLSANYLQIGKLYRFEGLHRFAVQFGALTASWIAVIVTLLLIAYFGKVSSGFSRMWAGYWFISAYLLLLTTRGAFSVLLHRWRLQGRLTHNVVVIGAGEFGARLIRHLNQQRSNGIRVLGLFDDQISRTPQSVGDYPVSGSIDELLLFVRKHRVDQIVIAIAWSAEDRLETLMQRLESVTADVTLCPGAAAFELPNMGYEDIGGIPMLTMQKPPLTGWSRVAKGIEDRVLAFALLMALWPLLIVIGVAIKLTSRGPILFTQRRYGFNNNEITVLKFRTMRWDSTDDSERTIQTQRNDPRVTPVGALLRRSSLDELPQLINVLLGDMSLVGPRPHSVAHNEQYAKTIDKYLVRHKVKPGITGWAQVNGLRGETHIPELMRRRVQFDLNYIENWSLLFDLKILALTIFAGFVHENAY
jgi:putative colanic acid biosynthesis UDP-glucose lipid carrier transferase